MHNKDDKRKFTPRTPQAPKSSYIFVQKNIRRIHYNN